jgi:hypothetical protein
MSRHPQDRQATMPIDRFVAEQDVPTGENPSDVT